MLENLDSLTNTQLVRSKKKVSAQLRRHLSQHSGILGGVHVMMRGSLALQLVVTLATGNSTGRSPPAGIPDGNVSPGPVVCGVWCVGLGTWSQVDNGITVAYQVAQLAWCN